MLTLKLQYFGHLMQRAGSLEKTLMLGEIEGGRRIFLIFNYIFNIYGIDLVNSEHCIPRVFRLRFL